MKWRNGLGMDDGAGLAICIIMQQTNNSFIIFDTHLTDQYPMHDHVYICNTSHNAAWYHCLCVIIICLQVITGRAYCVFYVTLLLVDRTSEQLLNEMTGMHVFCTRENICPNPLLKSH